MIDAPEQITLEQWDRRYETLSRSGLDEPGYGGRLGRHVEDGDYRLCKLRFDNSPAALRLWNFLLTEEDRLREARNAGHILIGTMKDLGTVPVMAYSLDNVTAFYPDGAWWIPCVMEHSAGLLEIADSLGIDESFCPVRAMLGAFENGRHFPIPDTLICSVGAVCDDFSAIAQRLATMGHEITWWEMPHRREPDPTEEAVQLPGGFAAPRCQVDFVTGQLERVKATICEAAGREIDDKMLSAAIRRANRVRKLLNDLRCEVFQARICPMPALEMLIAEMLAIHYCSDYDETVAVLEELLDEVRERIKAGVGVLDCDAARIFWVNPVADLRAMNLLEQSGGRICGTEYLFAHALDLICQNIPPTEALARAALADPMVGSSADRASRIVSDMRKFGSEALLVSRIPGASHCAVEGRIIGEKVRNELGLPVLEIEVPPVSDSMAPSIRTRLEALVETVKQRRTT